MGASASTTAIEDAKDSKETDIHTSDGLHFLTLNLDSNNDGSSVHPSSILFIIGFTIIGIVLAYRCLKCLRKQHKDWSSRYTFTRRPENVELGQVIPGQGLGGDPGPNRAAPAPPR